MLTKTEKALCDLIKSRDVDRDTCIGILLTLKTEDNYIKMYKWIEQNKTAGQTEIMRHLHTFMDMDKVPYFVMPEARIRKVYQ